MSSKQQGTGDLLSGYRQHLNEIEASFSSAVREVGRGPNAGAAQSFIIASLANALESLTKSLAAAVGGVGTDFDGNVASFKERLGHRLAGFGSFLKSSEKA
jgi:hypothetical protein